MSPPTENLFCLDAVCSDVGRLRQPFTRVPRHAWILAALALVARVAWFLIDGQGAASDTGYYLRMSDAVLADGFRVFVDGQSAFKYATFILFLAPIRALFGPATVDGWIGIQILIGSLAVIPLYLLARDIAGTRVAVLTGLVYAGLFEIVQWSVFPLTDTVFTAAVIVFAYLAYRAHTIGSRRAWLALGLAAPAMAFMRIAGIMYVGGVFLWLVSERVSPWIDRLDRHRQAVVAFGLVLLAVVGVLATLFTIGAATGENPSIAEYNAQGIVVDDDPTFDIPFDARPYPEDSLLGFATANADHFARLVLLRIGFFWAAFMPRFSMAHTMINATTFLPVVAGAFGAMVYVLWKHRSRSGLLLPIWMFLPVTFLHAVTLIDYDFRYRLPLMPFMAFLFAYAVVTVAPVIVSRLPGEIRTKVDRMWQSRPQRSGE